MYDEIIKANVNNLLNKTFVEQSLQKIKLYEIGYVKERCNINILALLIQCNQNLEIFNDKQRENINILINRYAN